MRTLSLNLLCIFMLSACSGEDAPSVDFDKVNAAILENQNTWQASGFIDYSFTYLSIPGDCPLADHLPAIDIYVEDGEIVSVNYTDTGETADVNYAMTMEQVFEQLLMLLEEQPIKFSDAKDSDELPIFDSNFGYPVSVFVDKSERECDATLTTITNFQ